MVLRMGLVAGDVCVASLTFKADEVTLSPGGDMCV